jgi:hypothetical protein
MAEQGRNTNFVAVSLISHDIGRRRDHMEPNGIACLLAPWPLLRVFFLHGSVKPGVPTAIQPQECV